MTNAHGLGTCELVHFLMLENGSMFLNTGFMLSRIRCTRVDGVQLVHSSHLYHARASRVTQVTQVAGVRVCVCLCVLCVWIWKAQDQFL